jgi:hypothetical protein
MKILIALMLVLATANAPAEKETGPEGPRGFRTLGCRVSAEEVFYESADKLAGAGNTLVEGKPAKIFDSARSDFHDRSGASRIVFFRKLVDAEGKPLRKVVAEADLSKGGPMPLILFIPDPARPETLRTLVLEDDARSFPNTTCRFVNMTPVNLGASLGTKTTTVPPAGTSIIATGLGEKSETRFATVTATTGDKTHRLYSNNWVMRPGTRTLILIYSVGGQAEVHRIADTAEP